MRWFLAALLFLGAVAVAATPSRAAGPHEVLISSTAFTPSPLTITLGEAVYWCNDDTATHSVVFEGEGAPDSGPLEHDDCTEDLTITEPGTYAYHDGHSSLTGSIVVDPPPTTTTTTTVVSPSTTTPPSITTAPPTVTTRRPTTSTTRRRTTTTAAFKKSATRELTTTTSAEPTTTTGFFDTTTSFAFTTTTFGSFAITELGDGDDGNGDMVLLLGCLAVLGGAGYLGWRYRWRLFR